MSYKKLYLDIIPTQTVCFFCNKPLKKLIATVLVDDNNNKVFAGPDCAEKNSINKNDRIPNLIGNIFTSEESDPLSKTTINENNNGVPADNKQKAIAYLLLRQEKMNEFANVHYEKFSPIYSRYLKGNIGIDDISYINNTNRYNEENNPRLGFINLRHCYTIDRLISVLIANSSKADFLESLQSYLRKNLFLTKNQLKSLNMTKPKIIKGEIKDSIFDSLNH